MAELVYIGLGSNLEQPKQQLKQAVAELKLLPDSQYVKDSGIYLSKPLVADGVPADQPDYYNAVVVLESGLSAVG